MNPHAVPFQTLKRTYTNAFDRSFYRSIDMAMKAPLAPIGELTDEQKEQMQSDAIGKNLTFQEFLALSTAFSVAQSVLE